MAIAPKPVEESTASITSAWEPLAATRSFGGMVLSEYQAKVAPSFETRERIKSLEAQLAEVIAARDAADKIALDANHKVICGVIGDVEFGDDSELYEAMGYVPRSKRQTGRRRASREAAPSGQVSPGGVSPAPGRSGGLVPEVS